MDPAGLVARLVAAPARPGRLDWIGLRTARRGPVRTPAEAVLDPAEGVAGDRYAGRTGTRQVTLIQAEHLAVIGSYLGTGPVPPERLRRNLVVSGLNLAALRGAILRIGPARLLITGPCAPCSRMEEELGPGGYNAVRGHGGVTARVLQGGTVRLNDPVIRLPADAPT